MTSIFDTQNARNAKAIPTAAARTVRCFLVNIINLPKIRISGLTIYNLTIGSPFFFDSHPMWVLLPSVHNFSYKPVRECVKNKEQKRRVSQSISVCAIEKEMFRCSLI